MVGSGAMAVEEGGQTLLSLCRVREDCTETDAGRAGDGQGMQQ